MSYVTYHEVRVPYDARAWAAQPAAWREGLILGVRLGVGGPYRIVGSGGITLAEGA